jgi:NlpC/P60 family
MVRAFMFPGQLNFPYAETMVLSLSRLPCCKKSKDTSADYLPLTRANIIRQAFKFLGERYGWGDLYNGRDCSGFASDVYRSMDVLLPPNSGAQGRSPAFVHRVFSTSDSRKSRVEAVLDAQIGEPYCGSWSCAYDLRTREW